MKLGATVFIKNTVEAADFYTEAFGLTLGGFEKNPDGTYMHAPLLNGDDEIFCLSESDNKPLLEMTLNSTLENNRPIMSYGIDFETVEELEKAYEMLIKEGTIIFPLGNLPWNTLGADVIDKYGVYWYIYVR